VHAISFSRGSSQPRDQTCFFCIAGEFFTTEPSGALINNAYLSFIYLFWLCWVFVAARGLSLVAVSGGYTLAVMHRLLIAETCLGAKQCSWAHGLQLVQLPGSRAQAR